VSTPVGFAEAVDVGESVVGSLVGCDEGLKEENLVGVNVGCMLSVGNSDRIGVGTGVPLSCFAETLPITRNTNNHRLKHELRPKAIFILSVKRFDLALSIVRRLQRGDHNIVCLLKRLGCRSTFTAWV
jgi:hypothetical protein